MKNLIVALALSLFVGCAHVARPPVPAMAGAPPPVEAWAKVLNQHVDNEGRVNFAALHADRADLDRFVAWIYDHSPRNAPQWFPTRAHEIAFHLNAYNALAMRHVLERGMPDTLAGFRKLGFFLLSKVQVGGESISLYDYENKVIRGYGEARVHFALNCMSVGCPRLPRAPFRAETLEADLRRETQRFLAESRNVETDAARGVVRLSEIFKFFTDDFLATAPNLITWVNRHRISSQPISEQFKVEFTPYDWTINRTPPR